MARNKKQLAVRLERIKVANWLLEWLLAKGMDHGSKAFEKIITPFAQEKGIAIYEVWKAWAILKESGRQYAYPGPNWLIASWAPVEADADGKIKARY